MTTDPHMFVSINDSRICVRCGEDLEAAVHKDPPQADVDQVMRAPGVTVRPLRNPVPPIDDLRVDHLQVRSERLVDDWPRAPLPTEGQIAALPALFEPDGYQRQKVSAAELGRKAGAVVHLERAAREARAELEQDAWHYYGEGRDTRPVLRPEAACSYCTEARELGATFCPACGRLLDLEPMRVLEPADGVVVGEVKPDRGLRGQASERTQEVLASFQAHVKERTAGMKPPTPEAVAEVAAWLDQGGLHREPEGLSPEWRQYLSGVTVVVAATNQDAMRAVLTLGRKNPGTPYMPRAFDALAYGSRVKAVVFVDGWDKGLPPEVAEQHRQGWLSRVAPSAPKVEDEECMGECGGRYSPRLLDEAGCCLVPGGCSVLAPPKAPPS